MAIHLIGWWKFYLKEGKQKSMALKKKEATKKLMCLTILQAGVQVLRPFIEDFVLACLY